MECHNGGIFHASTHIVEKLDAVHYKFLKDIDLQSSDAFLQFNFAPPSLRRNIGILGLLHKRVLGLSHPVFQTLLPFSVDVPGSYRQGDHNKQLYGHIHEVNFQLALHFRSIYALMCIHYSLPQNVVDCNTVTSLEKHLSKMARDACAAGHENWQKMFSCGAR